MQKSQIHTEVAAVLRSTQDDSEALRHGLIRLSNQWKVDHEQDFQEFLERLLEGTIGIRIMVLIEWAESHEESHFCGRIGECAETLDVVSHWQYQEEKQKPIEGLATSILDDLSTD